MINSAIKIGLKWKWLIQIII